MKKLILPIAAFALVAFNVSAATAATPRCEFGGTDGTNKWGPPAARGVKGSMVRNFAACPGTDHPGDPDTETEGGTPACTPVIPPSVETEAGSFATTYMYSEKGKCDVSTSAKLVSDCSLLTDAAKVNLGLQVGPCHVTYVKSKCSGILRGNGTTLIEGDDDAGWTLNTLSRATFDDLAGGDMTVINFPVEFQYSTPSKGKISINTSTADVLRGYVGPNNADLPACTQIEIVDVTIKDPQHRPFAKLGGATHPK